MKYIVSAILSLAAVAAWAQVHTMAISEIDSMQIRQDGMYNVLCKDDSHEVVSAEDVAANNVCPYVKPAGTLLEGTYKADSEHSSYCDQQAHVIMGRGQLQSIRLDYPACYGDFLYANCTGTKCSGASGGQNIEVTIVDSEHYTWNNISHGVEVQFTRTGDLPSPAQLAQMQLQKKSKSKIAGQ